MCSTLPFRVSKRTTTPQHHSIPTLPHRHNSTLLCCYTSTASTSAPWNRASCHTLARCAVHHCFSAPFRSVTYRSDWEDHVQTISLILQVRSAVDRESVRAGGREGGREHQEMHDYNYRSMAVCSVQCPFRGPLPTFQRQMLFLLNDLFPNDLTRVSSVDHREIAQGF